ncbi:MAG TPA: sulfatase-like hydrolase/transferase, partial [Polyangiaceae bacterium]|nr:sulfatase-like hydrolase/transferase [Polyangiaceae bacterium]
MRSLAVLLAVLVVTHEVLLAHARPLAWGPWAYAQLVVVAQSVFLAAGAGAASAAAPRFARLITGLAFTVPPLLYADSLVVVRIDRHLPSLLRLALDARLDDNRRLLDATGVDLGSIAVFFVGVVGVAMAGAWLAGCPSGPRSPGVRGRTLVVGWLAATVFLAALEAAAGRALPARVWSRVARVVPQVLGALGPGTRAKASLHAALRPLPDPATAAAALARLEMPSTPPPGDVYFFVVESLRADAVDPDTAPTLAALARDALPITTAVSGGNVTQYGWFSLFASRPALYWDPDDPGSGAVTLRVARRRGWRVEVLTSSDLRYMHLGESILGPSHALADDVFDSSSSPGSPAAHDVRVMTELAARAARPHAPTVFVVSLDATHLPYLWTDDFTPPFRPFAGEGHYMRAQVDPADRLAVRNRYRDAVAFVDSLLGRFVAGLRAARTLDDATIVVAGDHGEELWEHGLASHGSEACGVQTHIPLIVRLSAGMRAGASGVGPIRLASSIDVWPTLFDAAGVRGDTSALFDGRSLLRGPTGVALA